MKKFWKMHGAGNDFIAIDGRFDNIDSNDYSNFALEVCHRKFGVGADGVLIVKNSNVADVEMVYYNSDGSRGEMCGNGIRCFSKFVYENNIIKKDIFTVDTLDGIKTIELILDKDNNIELVKVDMGKANFNSSAVPVSTEKDMFIEEKISVLDKEFIVSSILMGVPHTVIFVDKLDKDLVLKYGSNLETHEVFPKKCNINFVEIIDRDNIKVCTWERGCGYTLACGTGMTSAVIVANYLDKTNKKVNVFSEGGKVCIDINNDCTYMVGCAVKVFEGII
ncbi:MAG: diaminopimelate epimerase [Romboutsia sp.]|nr:diaminopimelate epimerase [Romboutsia sp.]